MPVKSHRVLPPGAVAHRHPHAALHSLHPQFPLKQFHRFALGVGGGDEDQIGPQRGTGANALRQVAVKADHDAHLAPRGVINVKPILCRGVIILLVKQRGLCDVHHFRNAAGHPARINQQ
ncbi:hypothetical protein SDC9_192641 [bioreactor metagenome]|uniref:Uncharacterized protein n=1 Tax=bioreactor metagenome TaxID=1076179 RepID=A0A645I9T2_9ZZZZ